jgi:hypothetical protein
MGTVGESFHNRVNRFTHKRVLIRHPTRKPPELHLPPTQGLFSCARVLDEQFGDLVMHSWIADFGVGGTLLEFVYEFARLQIKSEAKKTEKIIILESS